MRRFRGGHHINYRRRRSWHPVFQVFATDPNLTTVASVPRNFAFVMAVGDIVAVNGKPAKGTLVVRQQAISLSPTPSPGQGVADVVRTAVSDYHLEIQQ